MKAKEIRDQSTEDLQALSLDLARDIFNIRSEKKVARKLDKPHLLRQKKRDRARVLTVLQEKV